MHYHALACAYDGSIARSGRIAPDTIAALRRVVASGRHLVLLSRRRLDDLRDALPAGLFAYVVAEYGGVLHRPGLGRMQRLTDPLPGDLVDALREELPAPLSLGAATAATDAAQRTRVERIVRRGGWDVDLVDDKDLLVIAPRRVKKLAGLHAALGALGLSTHNVVAVGDARSDIDFVTACECAVAVADAHPDLRACADVVTDAPGAQGLCTLIDQLVADDLASLEPRLQRRRLLLGETDDGAVTVPALHRLLLAGPAGTGKSTLLTGLLERLADAGYQFCVLDPEGDHADLPQARHLGDDHEAPSAAAVARHLDDPDASIVVNLLGRRLETLPEFLLDVLRGISELRARSGRPHWLVLDEAHHFLPLPGHRGAFVLPRWLDGLILATVNAEHIAPSALERAQTVVAFGDADRVLRRFAEAIGRPPPPLPGGRVGAGEAVVWRRDGQRPPATFRTAGGSTSRRPHLRRFAEAPLTLDKSFIFTGPDDRLRLRASTLSAFIDLAEGVDADTWRHHLAAGEYSRWMRDSIHDDVLADTVATIEEHRDAEAARREIVEAIRRRYVRGEA